VYQIIGLPKLLTGCTVLALLVWLIMAWISPPTSLVSWSRTVSTAIGVPGFICLVLSHPWIFGWLSRRAPLKWLVPDIAGLWEGHLDCNLPLLHQRAGLQSPTLPIYSRLDIFVSIRASLLAITVQLEAGDQTAFGHSIIATVRSEPDSDHARLFIIYDVDSRHGPEVLADRYSGAAYVDVLSVAGQTILDGNFWTNQSWRQGLNFAGTLRLWRTGQAAFAAPLID
jgi:hypothetical protein